MKNRYSYKFRFNLSYFLVVSSLILFLAFHSLTYEDFKGNSGNGYSFGFTIDSITIVLLFLLILSVPLYFITKKLLD